MMTSGYGHVFRIVGHLLGEAIGQTTKADGAGHCCFYLLLTKISCGTNSRDAGDDTGNDHVTSLQYAIL